MEKKREQKIEKLIEGLADVVVRGFTDIDDRFEQMDKRFEGIDSKLRNHDGQFETINSKLDVMLGRIEKVEHDIKSIRNAPDSISGASAQEGKTNKFLIKEVKRLDKELAIIKKELKIA